MTNILSAKQIKQVSSTILSVTWSDGHESPISLTLLRDSCPCAGCRGETVLFRTYVPPIPHLNAPGRYDLRKAEPVGNYGVKFTWGDTHDMGLYTWEHLRSLCECEGCGEKRALHQ
jgi:DUF971 family protein